MVILRPDEYINSHCEAQNYLVSPRGGLNKVPSCIYPVNSKVHAKDTIE